MSNTTGKQNDRAWESLFQKYKVLSHIEKDGSFIVSASQMRAFREPRLMAKIDHKINLPEIFTKNNLAILPISRGEYIIAHMEAYQQFQTLDHTITKVSLPDHIQSLDVARISSEAIAINCALASGILADFLEDEDLIATVSGRMGSGTFAFGIQNTTNDAVNWITVTNAQIEIDAAFEGIHRLSIIEAKMDLAEDFLIRQLYYPYRIWHSRISKPVHPIFFVYSNGICHLYEYQFQNPAYYNSLELIKHKRYSFEDTSIQLSEIQEIAANTQTVTEPPIPFPQADRFERLISLCEILNIHTLTCEEISEEYAFDLRQADYYTNAARYLGLVDKCCNNDLPSLFYLTAKGKKIINSNYKQRHLAFCTAILQHEVFKKVFTHYMDFGISPTIQEIVKLMQGSHLYNLKSENTYKRRSSTVIAWVTWMIKLTQS